MRRSEGPSKRQIRRLWRSYERAGEDDRQAAFNAYMDAEAARMFPASAMTATCEACWAVYQQGVTRTRSTSLAGLTWTLRLPKPDSAGGKGRDLR